MRCQAKKAAITAQGPKRRVRFEGATHTPYRQHLERYFGSTTYKVVVQGNLSCPTRDGAISQGGCAFCDYRGSSSYFGHQQRQASVTDQIQSRIPEITRRFGASRYLAYFQSYTNTHGQLLSLRKNFEEALAHPQISGICIGTRPDCLGPSVLGLLDELSRRVYVSVELGVQSLEDPTLQWLDRGHSAQCSLSALTDLRLHCPEVHTCAHLILGSPTDSPQMPERTAQLLNESGVSGIKLHQLMVLERTQLAYRYRRQGFPLLELSAYAGLVQRFLESLDPNIYCERLYALATHPEECIGPLWSRKRWETHNQLHGYLQRGGCRQGSRLSLANSA